jgi:hypothetical protein
MLSLLVWHKVITLSGFYCKTIDIFELLQVKSYLLGSLRRAFLIYGQTGTGKTSFIGKVAMLASENNQNF